MTQDNNNIVYNKVKKLIGTQVKNIQRNHGDIWIEFQDINKKKYILLMQTLFRLCNEERIIITDSDKYKPSGDVDEDDFEWDIPGLNLFDKWTENELNQIINDLVVETVKVNQYSDLIIIFKNHFVLTVYIEVTNDRECWRFFEKDENEAYDLIVLGNGVIVLE